MAKWRLAKSLVKLRDQINAASPHRSKVSDGSVGDLRHSARVSDHNPNSAGLVCAVDITHDVAHGIDGKMLSRWLTADPRTKYVIFNAEIWKARTKKWERYTGANKHTHHVHVSVTPEGADDTSAWQGIGGAHAEISEVKPALRRGDTGEWVKKLQTLLIIESDGVFGPTTEGFVKKFQAENGLEVDGKVGPATWKALET